MKSLWIPCEQYREGDKKTIDSLTQISVLDSTLCYAQNPSGGEANRRRKLALWPVLNSYDSVLLAPRIRRRPLRGYFLQNLSWCPFVYTIVL